MSVDVKPGRFPHRRQRVRAAFARFCARVRIRFRESPRLELEQNFVRAGNFVLFFSYAIGYSLVFGKDASPYVAAGALFLIYILAVFVWIYLSPSKSVLRRVLHAVADHAIVTWTLAVDGAWTSPFYILYLSVSIGNGARYGRPYLYLSAALSAIGFGAVILWNDYWRSLVPLNIALWLGILMLPYYAGLFYKRLETVNNKLLEMATRDMLTGLPNRPFLYDRLNEAIAAAERHRRPFTVMFVDIDNFKKINDADGHEVGDATLQAVARVLRDSIRKADTVARLGGDEFVVLLEGAHGSHVQIAENLREALAAYAPRVSVSIGVASYPECGRDAESLVQHADHAMYQAKRAGKDRCKLCRDVLGRMRGSRASIAG